jgi:hypothetical protein
MSRCCSHCCAELFGHAEFCWSCGSDLEESGTYEHWEPDDADEDDPIYGGAEWEPACVNGDGCPNEIRCQYCVPGLPQP